MKQTQKYAEILTNEANIILHVFANKWTLTKLISTTVKTCKNFIDDYRVLTPDCKKQERETP